MGERHHFDIIIAGAGPAGCAAAMILHEAGLRVCLVDDVSNAFPFKVGESLPGAAIRLLRRLGIFSLSALLPADNYKACVANLSAWGSEQWIRKDAMLNPEGGGWHLLRHQFDEALRKETRKRGIAWENNQIKEFKKMPDGTLVATTKDHTNLPGEWIIDATGRPASMAKKIGLTKKSFDNQMAAVLWFTAPKDDKDNCTRIKSTKNGWWYTARLPHQQRVLAFHGEPAFIARYIKNPDYFILDYNAAGLLPFTITKDLFLSEVIARKAEVAKLEQVAGSNWMAIGDAALSFDPLSSQGIFFALYSGIKCGEAIIQIKKQPLTKEKNLAAFQQAIDRVFLHNMQTRSFFYNSELRYPTATYWKSRIKRS